MAITFVTFALSATTDSTTLNITLPTVQAGDVMLLEYTHRGTGTGTLGGVGGSDWNNKFTQLYSADAFSVHLYWKRCDGSESGDALTVSGLTDSCAGCVTLYRGVVASGDPIEAGAGESNASANETHAAITTLTNLAWVVLTVANSPDLNVSAQSTTSPGALAERAERLNTTGTDTSISHASAEKATAGTTGNLTWSQTNAASGSLAYAITPEMPSIAMVAGVLAIAGLTVGVAFTGPDQGYLVLQGLAPTVSIQQGNDRTIEVPAGSLVYQGYGSTADLVIAAQAGSLTLSGAAPIASVGATLAVPAGQLVFTGHALTVDQTAGTTLPIPSGSLVIEGQYVAVSFLQPAAGSLVFTGFAPTVLTGLGIAIPAGALVLSGQAPVVALSVALQAGSLVFAGQAPSITGAVTISPPAGSLVLFGHAPVVARAVEVGVGALTLSGQTPSVGWSTGLPTGSLVLTGHAAEIVGAGAISVPSGSLTFTGQAPALAYAVAPQAGALAFSGAATTILAGKTIDVPVGAVTLTGQVQTFGLGLGLPAGVVTFTGQAPALTGEGAIVVPAGALVFTGSAPALGFTVGPDAGALTLTGHAPTVLSSIMIAIPQGTLIFSGQLLAPISPSLSVAVTGVMDGPVAVIGIASSVVSVIAITE